MLICEVAIFNLFFKSLYIGINIILFIMEYKSNNIIRRSIYYITKVTRLINKNT